MSTPATAPDDEESYQSGPRRPDLVMSLRSWQKEAYREYFRGPRRDFLLVATPGAGKTAFALTIAAELLARREIAAVTVVTPTEHLKHQWAQAAARIGLALDPEFRNARGRTSTDFTGVATIRKSRREPLKYSRYASFCQLRSDITRSGRRGADW